MFDLRVVDHPLIGDQMRQLRNRDTSNADFLRLAGEISRYLTYVAFDDAPTVDDVVDTPVAQDAAAVRVECEYLIVPILRAGLGMSPSVQAVLPRHRVCLVGLRRNEETLEPDVYLDGLPALLRDIPVVVCDPMLATGGSLLRVLDMLVDRGATDITVLCLIASRPGTTLIERHHPTIRLVCGAIDEHLNEFGYIVPGLGDAGDRLFGPPAR